ncbi:hypothetical protein COOONC_20033 [Cooperia oncophora]
MFRCEARKDGEVQSITWARFFRTKEKKVVAARLDPDNRRARLIFGNATAAQAGKYRCEIRTEDGELVFGNMFAYSRPVIHGNSSDPMEVSPSDPTLVTSRPLTASRESNATIVCPVYAYPHPHIVWYKDGVPLESSARVSFHRMQLNYSVGGAIQMLACYVRFFSLCGFFPSTSSRRDLSSSSFPPFRCVASNQFPIYVDGPEQEFEVKFDRELKIGVHYGWLLPLIIILIMLILLFFIIYCCQAYKRYKTKQYHVAERE